MLAEITSKVALRPFTSPRGSKETLGSQALPGPLSQGSGLWGPM